VLEKLEQLIDEIGALNSKLVLLIGPSNAGKTVGADPNLSHRADRILSQGWKPTLRGSAVDKCRC